MSKVTLWKRYKSPRNQEENTSYNISKQITRIENKINEISRILKGFVGN